MKTKQQIAIEHLNRLRESEFVPMHVPPEKLPAAAGRRRMKKDRIVHKKPPFYWLIKLRFPHSSYDRTVYTVWPWIYAKQDIDDPLYAHEMTHIEQQGSMGAFTWWWRYFWSAEFRAKQELAAYQKQYQYAIEHWGRERANRLLQNVARDLSGPMYGSIMPFDVALQRIKNPHRP